MRDSFISIGFLTELKRQYQHPEKKPSGLPRISIVMPSYNQERFIERSILSVLNQGYPNLQFIIIDGGSSDGTVEIIRKYGAHIDYWVSEPDKGQSDALNKGFQRATGDIYGWLNSDDLFLPGAFELAAEELLEKPGKNIVFGDWLSIGTDDQVLDYNHAFDFSLDHFKYEGFHLNAQAMFWRSLVHKGFAGFDVNLHRTMDYQMIMDFGVRTGEAGFSRISAPLGAFRRHEEQKTRGCGSPRVLEEHVQIADRYGYQDKYRWPGRMKRLRFRFRRAFWYAKRGGVSLLSKRILMAYRSSRE